MSTPFSHFFTKFNQISPQEADFTEVLSSIALKPKTLYFYGKLPKNVAKTACQGRHGGGQKAAEIRPKSVAIVGSRHSTKYGEDVAYQLAYTLARRGAVIVSGLAYGIDSIGHRGALDAGGTTVAVLGTPITQIYPAAHQGLAREIMESGGAIISEYPPSIAAYATAPLAPGEAGLCGGRWVSYEMENRVDSTPGPYTRRRVDHHYSFLSRNRLISGLSDVVVIVEAAERSGSLNTAMHALEQGREVFAVPGNITSPYSQGCNRLIREGAAPYTGPDDILRLLFPEDYIRHRQPSQLNFLGDSDTETAILQALATGCRSGDDIMAATRLSPTEFSQSITMLEIKSRVHSLGANNWSLM